MNSKRRPSVAPGQFAFSFDPPAPARREAGLAGLEREISAVVALILKEDTRTRPEIAGAMSALLDEEISLHMLNAYASEARENHSISAGRLLALIAVTNRHDLFDGLVRQIGASLLVGAEILTAELGHIRKAQAELRARERAIFDLAPTLKGRDEQ